jgi:hypothetical protein
VGRREEREKMKVKLTKKEEGVRVYPMKTTTMKKEEYAKKTSICCCSGERAISSFQFLFFSIYVGKPSSGPFVLNFFLG